MSPTLTGVIPLDLPHPSGKTNRVLLSGGKQNLEKLKENPTLL